jgi:hypothetical protein
MIIFIGLGLFMLFSLIWSMEAFEWLVSKINPSISLHKQHVWGEFLTGIALLTAFFLFVFDQWGEEPWSNLWWFITRYALFILIIKAVMRFDKK